MDVRGFPAVTATPEMRDRLDATGSILPGSRTKAALLAVDIDNPPAPLGDGASRWAGMSGAAVIENGFVVGVAVQDPKGFDSRQLVAVPVARFLADPEFCAVVRRHGGRVPIAEPVELAVLAERVRAPRTPAALLRADAARTPFRPSTRVRRAGQPGAAERSGSRYGSCTGPADRARPVWPVTWSPRCPGTAGRRSCSAITQPRADRRPGRRRAPLWSPSTTPRAAPPTRSGHRRPRPGRHLHAASAAARTAGPWRTERVGPSPLARRPRRRPNRAPPRSPRTIRDRSGRGVAGGPRRIRRGSGRSTGRRLAGPRGRPQRPDPGGRPLPHDPIRADGCPRVPPGRCGDNGRGNAQSGAFPSRPRAALLGASRGAVRRHPRPIAT